MYLKIIGGVQIAVSSYLLGTKWASTLKYRVDDIREFEQILEQLENEISFYSNILEEAFFKISKKTSKRISNVLLAMSKNLKAMPSNVAWEMAIKSNLKDIYLKKEDIEIVLSLSNLLGMSDVNGQIYNIKNIIARLKQQEKKAEEIRQKNEALYKNLSILVGVAIIILLL